MLKFEKIIGAAYDEINQKLLLFDKDKKVYVFNLKTNEISNALGTLSGELYPICTSWENGLLIATGGKLQYFNEAALLTIVTSPNASSVYVRAGRILITDENNIRYSAFGNEETSRQAGG